MALRFFFSKSPSSTTPREIPSDSVSSVGARYGEKWSYDRYKAVGPHSYIAELLPQFSAPWTIFRDFYWVALDLPEVLRALKLQFQDVDQSTGAATAQHHTALLFLCRTFTGLASVWDEIPETNDNQDIVLRSLEVGSPPESVRDRALLCLSEVMEMLLRLVTDAEAALLVLQNSNQSLLFFEALAIVSKRTQHDTLALIQQLMCAGGLSPTFKIFETSELPLHAECTLKIGPALIRAPQAIGNLMTILEDPDSVEFVRNPCLHVFFFLTHLSDELRTITTFQSLPERLVSVLEEELCDPETALRGSDVSAVALATLGCIMNLFASTAGHRYFSETGLILRLLAGLGTLLTADASHTCDAPFAENNRHRCPKGLAVLTFVLRLFVVQCWDTAAVVPQFPKMPLAGDAVTPSVCHPASLIEAPGDHKTNLLEESADLVQLGRLLVLSLSRAFEALDGTEEDEDCLSTPTSGLQQVVYNRAVNLCVIRNTLDILMTVYGGKPHLIKNKLFAGASNGVHKPITLLIRLVLHRFNKITPDVQQCRCLLADSLAVLLSASPDVQQELLVTCMPQAPQDNVPVDSSSFVVTAEPGRALIEPLLAFALPDGPYHLTGFPQQSETLYESSILQIGSADSGGVFSTAQVERPLGHAPSAYDESLWFAVLLLGYVIQSTEKTRTMALEIPVKLSGDTCGSKQLLPDLLLSVMDRFMDDVGRACSDATTLKSVSGSRYNTIGSDFHPLTSIATIVQLLILWIDDNHTRLVNLSDRDDAAAVWVNNLAFLPMIMQLLTLMDSKKEWQMYAATFNVSCATSVEWKTVVQGLAATLLVTLLKVATQQTPKKFSKREEINRSFPLREHLPHIMRAFVGQLSIQKLSQKINAFQNTEIFIRSTKNSPAWDCFDKDTAQTVTPTPAHIAAWIRTRTDSTFGTTSTQKSSTFPFTLHFGLCNALVRFRQQLRPFLLNLYLQYCATERPKRLPSSAPSTEGAVLSAPNEAARDSSEASTEDNAENPLDPPQQESKCLDSLDATPDDLRHLSFPEGSRALAEARAQRAILLKEAYRLREEVHRLVLQSSRMQLQWSEQRDAYESRIRCLEGQLAGVVSAFDQLEQQLLQCQSPETQHRLGSPPAKLSLEPASSSSTPRIEDYQEILAVLESLFPEVQHFFQRLNIKQGTLPLNYASGPVLLEEDATRTSAFPRLPETTESSGISSNPSFLVSALPETPDSSFEPREVSATAGAASMVSAPYNSSTCGVGPED